MRFTRFTFVFYLGLLVFGITAGLEKALATTTICSDEEAQAHRYGIKASKKFILPSADLDSITGAIKEFAEANGFTYSSVGYTNPSRTPAFRSLTHILQTQSVDVSIFIRITNSSTVAEASVKTFSYSCGGTEDWQPYWHAFEGFVTRSGYQIVP